MTPLLLLLLDHARGSLLRFHSNARQSAASCYHDDVGAAVKVERLLQAGISQRFGKEFR